MKKHKWTFQEERALVEFVGLSRMDPNYSDTSTEWPGFRESHSFWGEAARHIKESTSANFLLSSMFEIVLSTTTIIIIVCNYLLLLLVNE